MNNQSEGVFVSESHGYDVTVETIALEEFDYVESVNQSEGEE